MNTPKLTVSSSPHLHAKSNTASIMWSVSVALIPASLWGVYVFGWRALLVLLVSIAAAALAEFLLGRISHEFTLSDGSAVLTGLLVGMNMPPDVMLFVPILASFFAIAVIKWTFGGLGANWVNPALGGRVFVFFSFTSLMNTYRMPNTLRVVDAVGSATPLTAMKLSIADGAVQGLSSAQVLASLDYPTTMFALNISSWFSNTLGVTLSPYTVDAFFGNVAGCIGEVSAIMLILGAIYLFIRKIITWQIPVMFLGTFSLLAWMFGGLRNGMGLFQGDFVLQLFTGGMMLGAFFMATDMVTSPTTKKGMMIFGAGIGFFTFLLRYFGSLPESVSLAIILMNIFSPTIERYVLPKRFGEVVREKKVKKEAKA
jgi:Na+-translocating ferredoxin:NAD+ oxidoreductase subunit D